MAERYWVPTSLPWRMPWVGSWFSQKSRSISSYEVLVGSKTTSTASVWPVCAAAHLFVGRVRGEAAGVAHRRRVDARRLPEHLLGAPEAAHTEHGLLEALRERRAQRRAEHGVAIRNLDRLGAARQCLRVINHRGLTAYSKHAYKSSRPGITDREIRGGCCPVGSGRRGPRDSAGWRGGRGGGEAGWRACRAGGGRITSKTRRDRREQSRLSLLSRPNPAFSQRQIRVFEVIHASPPSHTGPHTPACHPPPA